MKSFNKRLKTGLFVTLWTICSLSSFAQNTDGDELFNDNILHEIRFESMDTNTFIQTKDYQRVKIVVDGNIVDSVGVKRKGNISGYSTTNKYGLKIKTNKYVSGKEYDGTKEFTLHMNYQDPSMLREKLTYELADELGLYSLRTSFAKVYLNDVYWGLYTIVEGKDEMYKQVFNNRGMDAIESLDFGDMCHLFSDPTEYDVDNNSNGFPYYQLENGDGNTAWINFEEMLDKANNTSNANYVTEVSNYLNLQDFFKYQALNVYLMNMDSYLAFLGNQIYVYDTTANVWQITPWDFNASFGLWNTNNYSSNSFPYIPNSISTGCIALKMNEIQILKDFYNDAMCLLYNELSNTEEYFNRIDFLKEQIESAVYSDYRKVITDEQFDNSFEGVTQALFGEDIPTLKNFIADRNAVILNGFFSESYTCDPSLSIGNENLNSEVFSIYPNPFLSNINLSNSVSSLNILSIDGNNIMTVDDPDLNVNLEHLKIGTYIVSFTMKDGSQVIKKLIKE